jgi:hypothetical protein
MEVTEDGTEMVAAERKLPPIAWSRKSARAPPETGTKK